MVRCDIGKVVTENSTSWQGFSKTILYLLENSAKVLLLGNSKSLIKSLTNDGNYSFEHVTDVLMKQLNKTVTFVPDCIGTSVAAAVQKMQNGQIALLENVGLYEEDEQNEAWFSEALGRGIDIYVNDDCSSVFANASSVLGICNYVPTALTGFSFEKEFIDPALHTSLKNRSFTAVLVDNTTTLNDLNTWPVSNVTFPQRCIVASH